MEAEERRGGKKRIGGGGRGRQEGKMIEVGRKGRDYIMGGGGVGGETRC